MAAPQPSAAPFSLPSVVPFFIDGKSLTNDSLLTIPVISNISGGKTIHHALSADRATANLACESAMKSFKTWKKTPITVRRALLTKFADIITRRKDEIAAIASRETSSSPFFQSHDLMFCANAPREIANGLAEAVRGDVIPMPDAPNAFGMTLKEPVGPVLIISPWNSSTGLSARAICTAIAVGCTVVFKQSELCPMTHHVLVKCFEEAGVPAGVINAIQVRREDSAAATEAIIAHNAIRKVDFIGSANIGRLIGQTCAKYLKPILMELGGKGPAIVLDDANLQQAATLCAQGALVHHGQICFSTERIIVVRSVAEKFKELLIAAVQAYKLPEVAVNSSGAQHAYEVLKDAAEHGAEFLVGSASPPVNGHLAPAIILEPKDCRVVDEETFGPSASLYVVDNEDEAIELANRSAYGLTAAVHTSSMERGLRVSKELEYGQVHVNQLTLYSSLYGSQGGVKGSGCGRMNGKWGYEEFQNLKLVTYFAGQVW